MVTGYLLAASYEKRPIENKCKYLLKKYIGLAPGYCLALVVYVVLNLLFQMAFDGSPYRTEYSAAGIVINVAFLHGLVPFCNNTIVPGGWYVGTLMLIYALLPFVFPLLRRRTYAYRIAPFVSCVLALVVGVIVGILDPSLVGNNSFYYYSIICQTPALLMGVVLYYERERILELKMLPAVAVFGGFSVITLGILAVGINSLIALIPFTAALSYVGVYVIVCRLTKKWKFELLQKIGSASYGNYLFHFIFAWFVPYAVKRLVAVSNTVLFAVLLIPCFALSCVLGIITTRFVGIISRKVMAVRGNGGGAET